MKGVYLSLVAALLVPGHAWGVDPATLQKEFASAKDLVLVNRVSDLPPDANSKLDHIPWLQGLRLADFGAPWGVGDSPAVGLPIGQHLFSGVSERLVAVVFLPECASVRLPTQVPPAASRRRAKSFARRLDSWRSHRRAQKHSECGIGCESTDRPLHPEPLHAVNLASVL
jgi:hypothetical protein